MKTVIIFLFSHAFLFASQAQTLLQGNIHDQQNKPLTGANVYLLNTYDGTSSDSLGDFSFESSAEGQQSLVVSAIGYQPYQKVIQIGDTLLTVDVRLQESSSALDAVTITAGAFEAGESKKSVVLTPLDIVTTAGALGDINGALQTLPGTQTVGEDGRLFIRGGEGYETQVFIDGMLAHTPYNASVPNLPTRGRFSPFLFRGTTFSTGGYSAEYGQALSSALILATHDKAEQTQTDISLMTVGTDLTHQHAWEKASIAAKAEYVNLKPYQLLMPQDLDMYKAPETFGGSLVGRKRTSNTGLLKGYVNYNQAELGLHQNNINHLDKADSIYLSNNNLYANLSYREVIGEKWTVRSGLSYTFDRQYRSLNENRIEEEKQYWHAKTVFTYDLSDEVAIRMGGEHMDQQTEQKYGQDMYVETQKFELGQNISATFIEGDIYLSSRLVIRPGLRYTYSGTQDQYALSPRFSMAYKTSKDSQLSWAYGQYYQQAITQWLLQKPELEAARADHYILNYQLVRQGKTFRIEAYHKQYDQLIKFETDPSGKPVDLNNEGKGYARGLDIFWRDRKSIPNGDYWISYSLLDTERDYLNYPQAAMPGFASRHNFSAVYKHFIPEVRTQFGGSYQWASSRSYHDPNQEEFQSGRTPSYHNLSLNAAFLYKQNIIFYASMSNVLGTRNIFGYEYAEQADMSGKFAREAIVPPAPRFFFMGVFITLSKDQQANQLDQL
ncbi:hypothetical protein OKW21_004026 [Catalinimonas alkaloidigena]|uniref:TonB-dependent receptor n=1 Tax=Catalinimonas alkaloidigena TaxID=1075417 RepID=UPI002404C44F|nr:TonB-dependent receptor [Catalinimonas alkaloidigena]MDF9798763.1 hypothetical protein [Catalinimonas alkaloidigena]